MARSANLVILVLPIVLLLAWVASVPGAYAEEAWETAWRQAEAEQDRKLSDARQRGTTGQLVGVYASRLSRQPTALNYYLLGRAHYYDGDEAGAKRRLQETLRQEPRFWPARLRLALLELKQERPAEARRYVEEVLRVRPKERDALRLLAQIHMDAQDLPRALQVLKILLALDPADETVRRNLAFVLMAMEKWDVALPELRLLRGRHPRDPAVRWYYANALFHTKNYKEAARELEGLLRLDPEDARSLELLRVSYYHLEDWKSLEKTLERLLPLLPDGEHKDRVRQMLEQLRRGPPEQGQVPQEAPEDWPENTWLALVERCMHPTDVKLRREALQIYFEADFPRIPHALVSRIHHLHEPDAICRSWLLRIIGSMQNPQLAQVTAYALFDPDASVRANAAQTLGEIGTPSGILYLMPVLLGREISNPPTPAQVDELNRARAAMVLLTGRRDTLGGVDTWIDGASLSRMRKDWMAWLASPDGVHVRVQAITDLEAQGDGHPERVLVEDVLDPSTEVAVAAYGVLLRRSKRPSDEEVGTKMWPHFPRFGPDELKPEVLGRVREAVRAWWQKWLEAARTAASSTDGG